MSIAEELQRLATLHRSGDLSDAEFAAAKQHLLSIGATSPTPKPSEQTTSEETTTYAPSDLPEGLSFDSSSVSYNRTVIAYSQVVGVTFYSVAKSLNLIPSIDSYHIQFRSNDAKIDIRSDGLFRIGSRNRRQRFSAAYAFASNYVFPNLVQRIIAPTTEQGKAVTFRQLTIDPAGISYNGFFSTKTLAWKAYYNCCLTGGRAEIYERADNKRKYRTWEFFLLHDENTVLLPLILNGIFQRCHR